MPCVPAQVQYRVAGNHLTRLVKAVMARGMHYLLILIVELSHKVGRRDSLRERRGRHDSDAGT